MKHQYLFRFRPKTSERAYIHIMKVTESKEVEGNVKYEQILNASRHQRQPLGMICFFPRVFFFSFTLIDSSFCCFCFLLYSCSCSFGFFFLVQSFSLPLLFYPSSFFYQSLCCLLSASASLYSISSCSSSLLVSSFLFFLLFCVLCWFLPLLLLYSKLSGKQFDILKFSFC